MNAYRGLLICHKKLPRILFRSNSSASIKKTMRLSGLVLGAHETCTGMVLTSCATEFNKRMKGRLSDLLAYTNDRPLRVGEVFLMNNLGTYHTVALVGLGPDSVQFNECENLDEGRENIRKGSAAGVLGLRHLGITDISVECMGNALASAEGTYLAAWTDKEYSSKSKTPHVCLGLYNPTETDCWNRGKVLACAQNTARELEQTPPNILTPKQFGELAAKKLCPAGITVKVRDVRWLKEKRFTAVIEAAKSSCNPPILLELYHCGGNEDDKPVVFVGKGCTFDSGGIALKCVEEITDKARSDTSGAAVLVGLFEAMGYLNMPLNAAALIPIHEKLTSATSLRPGDIVYNNVLAKHIKVADVSKDDRALLSDPVSFTKNIKPCMVMTVGNLTKGIRTALGTSSSGAFTNSNAVWRELKIAGAYTGDRVWRMPLWKHFVDLITDVEDADVNNIGKDTTGDPCSAAAFLSLFLPPVDFCHLDITGVGADSKGYGFPYLSTRYMTGRPTRTLFQFMYQLACPECAPSYNT